jgi:hypothetical protein
MSLQWWDLPGPGAFVGRIAADLKRGASVQVCLPDRARDGLRSALERELSRGQEVVLDTLEAKPDLRPVDAVARFFGIVDTPGRGMSAQRLLASPHAQGRFLWVRDFVDDSWRDWQAFLEDFQAATREVGLHERLLLILELPATKRAQCREDVELSLRIWDRCVSFADAYLYAALRLQDRDIAPVARELMIAIIVRLGLWDTSTIECLAERNLAELLEPWELLREIGVRANWVGSEEPCWASGSAAIVDGKEYVHSAWLVLHGGEDHVRRRMWQAQIQVLFPFVEERRQELLESCKQLLRVPFLTKNGHLISDVSDLEIGHIEYQLYERDAQLSLRQFAGLLKGIRNDLSHLRLVSATTLKSQRLQEYF